MSRTENLRSAIHQTDMHLALSPIIIKVIRVVAKTGIPGCQLTASLGSFGEFAAFLLAAASSLLPVLLGSLRGIGIPAPYVLDPAAEVLQKPVSAELPAVLVDLRGDGYPSRQDPGDVPALPVGRAVDLGMLVDDSVLWRLLAGLEVPEHGLLGSEQLNCG